VADPSNQDPLPNLNKLLLGPLLRRKLLRSPRRRLFQRRWGGSADGLLSDASLEGFPLLRGKLAQVDLRWQRQQLDRNIGQRPCLLADGLHLSQESLQVLPHAVVGGAVDFKGLRHPPPRLSLSGLGSLHIFNLRRSRGEKRLRRTAADGQLWFVVVADPVDGSEGEKREGIAGNPFRKGEPALSRGSCLASPSPVFRVRVGSAKGFGRERVFHGLAWQRPSLFSNVPQRIVNA
jgi:hypothetical protein